jgi:hypothetical protein
MKGPKCIALGRVRMKMVNEVGGSDARQKVTLKALKRGSDFRNCTSSRGRVLSVLQGVNKRLLFLHYPEDGG